MFLDFLAGNQTFHCTPWGNPTRTYFGWQRPCYLLGEGYAKTFKELMETTDWDRYGTGNYEKCADCMVHSGYEATAVAETVRKPWKRRGAGAARHPHRGADGAGHLAGRASGRRNTCSAGTCRTCRSGYGTRNRPPATSPTRRTSARARRCGRACERQQGDDLAGATQQRECHGRKARRCRAHRVPRGRQAAGRSRPGRTPLSALRTAHSCRLRPGRRRRFPGRSPAAPGPSNSVRLVAGSVAAASPASKRSAVQPPSAAANAASVA